MIERNSIRYYLTSINYARRRYPYILDEASNLIAHGFFMLSHIAKTTFHY